jgi:hypothetical protein
MAVCWSGKVGEYIAPCASTVRIKEYITVFQLHEPTRYCSEEGPPAVWVSPLPGSRVGGSRLLHYITPRRRPCARRPRRTCSGAQARLTQNPAPSWAMVICGCHAYCGIFFGSMQFISVSCILFAIIMTLARPVTTPLHLTQPAAANHNCSNIGLLRLGRDKVSRVAFDRKDLGMRRASTFHEERCGLKNPYKCSARYPGYKK